MLNFFKKVEESKEVPVDGLKDAMINTTSSSFEPPKNLPDLAKDIYEPDQSDKNNIRNIDTSNQTISTNQINSAVSKVNEPDKNSVPKLDLSIVREQLNSSQYSKNSLTSNNSNDLTSLASLKFNTGGLDNASGVSLNDSSKNALSNSTSINNSYSSENSQSYSQSNSKPALYSNSAITNDSIQKISLAHESLVHESLGSADSNIMGFFKEFEEYIRNNGFNDGVIEGMLNKNLLDNMVFYHTLKSADAPFYNSSSEFSHAVQLRLEELHNLERNWILNKNKLDLLKKFGSTIESEVYLKSEELKHIMRESKKLGFTKKSNDFFPIMVPKSSAVSDPLPNLASNSSFSEIDSLKNASSKEINVKNNSFNSSVSINAFSDKSDNSDFVSKDNLISGKISSSLSSDSSSVSPVSSSDSSYVSLDSERFSNSNVTKKFLNNTFHVSKKIFDTYVVLDPSKYFYSNDGQIFKSLNDLMLGIESMADSVFKYHVTGYKNDFANWVRDVFGDLLLSDAINSFTTKKDLIYFFIYLSR